MKCPTCQVEVTENAAFCSQCGAKIVPAATFDAEESPKEDPSPETATEKFTQATGKRDTSKEETLWEGTYSGKAMFSHCLLGGLISVGMIVLSIYLSWTWLWYVTLGISVVVWLYIAIVYAKNRFGVRYRLTSHRFFHETGILLHKTDLIEVIDIDDITYTRTIIDRLTGVGTIHIDSSDRSHPQLSIPGISNVEEVARLFQDTRHEERRRRAIHIESV